MRTLPALFLLLCPATVAAQTISSPAPGSVTIVRPWKEYATHELRDAWDMKQRTDMGFLTWGIDQPTSHMTGKKITTDSWGNDVFQGTPSTSDPSFFLLDPLLPGSAPLGKVGSNYPVNTSNYTYLYVKMRVANEIKVPAFGQIGTLPVMQVFWSRDTISSSYSNPEGRLNGGLITMVNSTNAQIGVPYSPLFTGCNGANAPCGSMEGSRYVIHAIPLKSTVALAALGTGFARWKNVDDPTDASSINWGATPSLTADSIRFDPAVLGGSVIGQIDVDWVRLVAPGAEAAKTLTWTGGSTYDIVISTQADCGANGNYAVLAYAQASGFQFFPEAWPNGTYYIGLRDKFTANNSDSPASRQLRSCSTGRYVIRDYPEFTFTSPNPLGSSDDFATVELNNPWDFTSPSDIDVNQSITSGSYTTLPLELPNATNIGTKPVFRGVGTADPQSYLMRSDKRGLHTRIDTSRYRLVTFDMGVNHERDMLNGSIARIVWHIAGETWNTTGTPSIVADAENVMEDIVLRHMKVDATKNQDSFSTRYTLDRIQVDLADRFKAPLESDPGPASSPSRTGWQNTFVKCASGPVGCSIGRIAPFDRAGIDNFRVDFHEFSAPTEFWVSSVRLAAHEKTTGTFGISWTSLMPAANPSGESAASWRVALFAVPTKPETSPGAGNASPMTPVSSNCSTPGLGIVALTSGGTHPALSSGSFTWFTPTPGLTSGALYFICAGLITPGDSTPTVFNFSQWPVVYDPSATDTPAPRLYLNQTNINMTGWHTGSSTPPFLSSKTPPQTVNVTQAGGSSPVDWVVDVCRTYDPANPTMCTNTLDYIQLVPANGTGSGSFTIQLKDSSMLPPSTGGNPLGVVLRVSPASAGATSTSAQFIQVNIQIIPAGTSSAPPFGQVDTPSQGAAGVQGAIGVTGWALDDQGLSSVKVYRNCLPFDIQQNCTVRLGVNVVFVGDAAFVPGARPDVEAAYPNYPQANQAGWGYLLLTNMLPHIPNQAAFGGQGPLTLYVIATDLMGSQTLLGRALTNNTPTGFSMANDSIAKPFGSIDTPAQGGATSGFYANFGWALTPDTNTTAGAGDIIVPVNGSTMTVYIDGVPVGNVGYNQCRGSVGNPVPGGVYCNDDVANLFGNLTPQPPGTTRTSNPTRFRNLDSGRAAIGAFVLNTSGYSNGLHSIAWGVSDSAGRVEGIGSRNFTITNGAAHSFSADTDPEAVIRVNPVGPDLGHTLASLRHLERIAPTVPVRLGMNTKAELRPAPVQQGVARITAREFERVELALPRTMSGEVWDGYEVQHGVLTPLPVGSFLDRAAGRFMWQSTPGYLGEYNLVFVRTLKSGRRETLQVKVRFGPRW